MPGVKKCYRIVHEALLFINDVDGTYSDGSRAAVTIVQPISVVPGELINEDIADAEMFQKSVRNGLIKKFVIDGKIKIVYVDEDTKKEISEKEYNVCLRDDHTVSEVDKLAGVLADRGLTADKLIAILDKVVGNTNQELTQEKKIVPSSVQQEEIIESKTYDEYSRIPYQKRLKAIHSITDINLLNEILQKDKSALSIKTVNKRLRDLGAVK